jgi:hypothetical protein
MPMSALAALLQETCLISDQHTMGLAQVLSHIKDLQ